MQSEKTYHRTQMGTALYQSPDISFETVSPGQVPSDYSRLLTRFTSSLAGQKLIKALQAHFHNNSDQLEYPEAFSAHKAHFDQLRAVAMLFKLEAEICKEYDYEHTVSSIDELSKEFISTHPIEFEKMTPGEIQAHFDKFMSEQSAKNTVFQNMTPIQQVLMEHRWIGEFIDGADPNQRPRIWGHMLSDFKYKHQGILRDNPKINACLEIQLLQQPLGDTQSFTDDMTEHLEQLMPLNSDIEHMPVVYNVMQSALPRQPLAMLANHLSPSLYQRNGIAFRELFNQMHNIFNKNGCHFDGLYFKFCSLISQEDIQASREGREGHEEYTSKLFEKGFLLDYDRAMRSLEIQYDIQQSIDDDGNTVTEISSDSCLTIPEAMRFHQVTLMSEASWFGTFQDHLENKDTRRVFRSPLYEQNFKEDKAKAIFGNLKSSLSDFCTHNTIFQDLLPNDEAFHAHQTAWLSLHQAIQTELPEETGMLINEFERITQSQKIEETTTSQNLHLLMYLRELSLSENLRDLQPDELQTLRESYHILAPIMGSEPAISALFSKQDRMASQLIKLSEYETQLSSCPHLKDILGEIGDLEVDSKRLATIVKDCFQNPHQTPESLTQFRQDILNVKKVEQVRNINDQLKINRNMITVGGIICVSTIVAATAAVMILNTLFAIGLSALALSMGTGIASVLYSSRQNLKNQKKAVCTLKLDTGYNNHPSMRNRSAVTVKTVFTATVSAIIIASCIGVPTYLFQSSITGGVFTMIPIGSGIMPTITTAAAIGLALLLTIFASILISNFLFGTAASRTSTHTNTPDLRSALDLLLNPSQFNPSDQTLSTNANNSSLDSSDQALSTNANNSPPSSPPRSPRPQSEDLLRETYESDGEKTLQETFSIQRPTENQLNQIAPHIIQSGEYAPKQIAAQLGQFFDKNDEGLIILREVKTEKGAPYYGGGTRITECNSKKTVFEVQTLFRLCDQINDVDIMIPIKTTTTCTFEQNQLESIQAHTEISEKHKRLILQALATQHDRIGGFEEQHTQHQGGQRFQKKVNSVFGEDTTELRASIASMNKGSVFEPSVSEDPSNPTAAGELKDQSSNTRGHCNAQRADNMQGLNPSTKKDETNHQPSP